VLFRCSLCCSSQSECCLSARCFLTANAETQNLSIFCAFINFWNISQLHRVSFCFPWCHCTPCIKCTAKMQVLWIFQHLRYCMQLGSHFMQWSSYWFSAIGVLHLPHQASHGPCTSKKVRNSIAHSISSLFINQAKGTKLMYLWSHPFDSFISSGGV